MKKTYLPVLAIFLLGKPCLLAQPGTLDPAFGTSGILTMPNSFDCGDMLVQPDGKILVLGAFNYLPGGSELLRLLPDGSLDVSFSGDGIAETNGNPGPNESQIMRALALQPDGKIICCGRQSDPMHVSARLILVRFHADGTRDNSFGSLGEVFAQEPVTMEPMSVAVQPDGKIIALAQYGGKTHLYRYLSNGQMDLPFGADGKVVLSFAFHNCFKVLVQPDGKILMAGQRQYPQSNYDGLLVRLLAHGAYDNGFGTNGVVEKDFEGGFDAFHDAMLQPDGKIVAVGKAKVGSNTYLAVLSHLANGAPDPDFGDNGTALIVQDGSSQAYAAALQSDGKIVVSGTSNILGNADYICARFNTDGSLDNTFSGDGMVLTNVGGPFNSDNANAVAMQPDGKILLAGDDGSKVVLVRYHSGLSVGVVGAPSTLAEPLVFPNPLSLSGGPICLKYELPAASPVRIELLDLQGKSLAVLLQTERFSGKNTETLVLPSGLAEGIYLLNIQAERGNVVVQVVVQR